MKVTYHYEGLPLEGKKALDKVQEAHLEITEFEKANALHLYNKIPRNGAEVNTRTELGKMQDKFKELEEHLDSFNVETCTGIGELVTCHQDGPITYAVVVKEDGHFANISIDELRVTRENNPCAATEKEPKAEEDLNALVDDIQEDLKKPKGGKK